MAPRSRPELLKHKRFLAGLIVAAWENGQRAEAMNPKQGIRRWTADTLANAVSSNISTVQGWRDEKRPHRPPLIMPLLRVFYGDRPEFQTARQTMLEAWRRAGGVPDIDSTPPPPRTIEPTPFTKYAEIVDLEVSQPTPDNHSNLIVPVTLRLHPDTNCEFEGKKVEIGVTEPYVMIESAHWRPSPDSVFRGKKHPKLKGVGRSGTIRIVGDKDSKGRIDDTPLEDEPRVTMEPLHDGADGPITFSVRVPRDGFLVTPRDAAPPTDAQNTVLDAIFNDGAFPQDDKKRLTIASETVRPRATRDSQ
ncbi:MAG: hypothetical protein EXR07_09740 [Acetobacteraceae bacterium]|nr:hypothetical protein [Acetobacteraceae bacterium]